MVGRMPKRQSTEFGIPKNINADQLATEFGDVPETPEQRKQSLRAAQQSSMNLQSAIAEHDAREERRMRALSERAKNPGNMLSWKDLMGGIDMSGPQLSRAEVMQGMEMGGGGGFLTEQFPTSKVDDYLMEELYQQPQRQPVRQQQVRQPIQQTVQQPVRPLSQTMNNRQPLIEQKPIRSSTMTNEKWKIKRYIGETRSGNEVAVWRVENVKTGSKLETLFRLEGIATRVSMYLNESGDVNDPRAIGLINTYQRRDKLLKEARLLEKSADGKPMKSERLRQIRAEINQLDYKLGV